MAKKIQVKSNGRTNPYRTDAHTVGELFTDAEFREDFSVSDKAQPTIDEVKVDMDTVLKDGVTVGYYVGASGKNHKLAVIKKS